MLDFFDQTRPKLAAHCHDLGVPTVHADNLFRAAYKQLNPAPWTISGLPRALSEHFAKHASGSTASISRALRSGYDGSVKFLVRLRDEREVEAVLMPESKRITLCISSQVGCRQACSFCNTGRMGLLRHLTAGEIVEQVRLANEWIETHQDWSSAVKLPAEMRVTNIVFMGMGEPLDNVENVVDAIHILTDHYGFNIALRRVSVSTAGHLDGLQKIVTCIPNVRLALSFHAPQPAIRSRLMPINRRWPVEDVLSFMKTTETYRRNGILIQYTVIHNVNDSEQDAEALIAQLKGMNVKINLIPFNDFDATKFVSPCKNRLESFRDQIHAAGIRVMVRYSKGQDIAAACGQLVRNN